MLGAIHQHVRSLVDGRPIGGVNVGEFGAKPDDASAASSNVAAIAAAYAEAKSLQVPLVFGQGGVYYVDDALTIDRAGQVICGSNLYYTELRQTDPTKRLFTVTADSSYGGGRADSVRFENLRMVGQGAGTHTAAGVYADESAGDGDFLQFDNCDIRDFDIGVHHKGFSQIQFANSLIHYNRVNIYNDSSTGNTNTIQLLNTLNSHATETGVVFGAGLGCTMIGGDHGNQPLSVEVQAAAQVTILGGNFESVTGSGTEFITVGNNATLGLFGARFLQGAGSIRTLTIDGYGHVQVSNCAVSVDSNSVFSKLTNAAGQCYGIGTTLYNGTAYVEDANSERHALTPFMSVPDNSVPTAAAKHRGMMLFVPTRSVASGNDQLWVFYRDSTGAYQRKNLI